MGAIFGGFFFFCQIPCHIQLQLCLSSPDPIPIPPSTIPIFSTMDTYSCFQCPYISFLNFSQTRRVLCSFIGLLPALSDFLYVKIKSFCASRKRWLRSCQLSSLLLLYPWGSFQQFSSCSSLNKWPCALLEPSPLDHKFKYIKDFFLIVLPLMVILPVYFYGGKWVRKVFLIKKLFSTQGAAGLDMGMWVGRRAGVVPSVQKNAEFWHLC